MFLPMPAVCVVVIQYLVGAYQYFGDGWATFASWGLTGRMAGRRKSSTTSVCAWQVGWGAATERPLDRAQFSKMWPQMLLIFIFSLKKIPIFFGGNSSSFMEIHGNPLDMHYFYGGEKSLGDSGEIPRWKKKGGQVGRLRTPGTWCSRGSRSLGKWWRTMEWMMESGSEFRHSLCESMWYADVILCRKQKCGQLKDCAHLRCLRSDPILVLLFGSEKFKDSILQMAQQVQLGCAKKSKGCFPFWKKLNV